MKQLTARQILSLQKDLLAWFDRHRRVMPWRALKGKRPNPYHVWLSEIMLQQTTVATVGPYFHKFIKTWPTLKKLAAADLDDVLAAWAGLGYYARARNLHRCAQKVVNEYGGVLPDTEEELLALPGIGPYTAAAIASIAFGRHAVAVDGNVERVISRFFAIDEPLPKSKKLIKEKAAMLAANNPDPGDFTQGLMELGSLICTPRQPKCDLCPWQASCAAQKKGNAEELPRTTPKKKKPVKYGRAFWVVHPKTGKFLIQKRPDKGLYAGMYQLPTTDWGPQKKAPGVAALSPKLVIPVSVTVIRVKHVFSHFDLFLDVWEGSYASQKLPSDMKWVDIKGHEKYALPALMRKIIALCASK